MRRLLLIAFVACAAVPVPAPHPIADHPSESVFEHIYASTVRLEVYCDDDRHPSAVGTGFAISRRHVITARHVVDCENKQFNFAVAHLYNGHRLPMVLDLLPKYPSSDAARLVIAGIDQFDDFAHVAFYTPVPGQALCIVANDGAIGDLYPKCGLVGRSTRAVVTIVLRGVPGNSGSALWDLDGNVLGIASRARWWGDGEFFTLAQRPTVWEDLLLVPESTDLE